MSIETLLTLGLTAAILVAAFVLRVVILGSLRLGLRLAGKDTSWTRPQVVGAGATSETAPDHRPARQRRPLWTPGTAAAVRTKAAGLGASVLAMAATAWAGILRGVESLERWADRTSESLEPAMRDITSAARRSTRDIGKYLVAAIATVQHVVLLLAGWVHRMVTERDSTDSAGGRAQPEPKKVIDLDLDNDPLDSPRSTRSRISV